MRRERKGGNLRSEGKDKEGRKKRVTRRTERMKERVMKQRRRKRS